VLLCIIYSTFCDTFSGESFAETAHYLHANTLSDLSISGNVDVDTTSLLAVVFTVVAILFSEMAFLFFATNRANFAPRDVVCILFCATHKSLTLGMPNSQ
jgi:sodium/bile acid cotransporter 7